MKTKVPTKCDAFPYSHKMGERFEGDKWIDIPDAPVNRQLSKYSVIFDAGSGKFHFFGGEDQMSIDDMRRSKTLKSILTLNAATWTWTPAGELQSARSDHGVILVGSDFMIIGGNGTKPVEACLGIGGSEIICEERDSSLDSHLSPLLFLVDDNYKNCLNEEREILPVEDEVQT